MEYNCHCGAEASFFCVNDQSHLCLHHRRSHNTSHNLLFNKSLLSRKTKNELLSKLRELSQYCENSLENLQTLLDKFYSALNQAFESESQKLITSLTQIQQIVESLENSEDFTKALNIYSYIQENPKSLLESLTSRVSCTVNDSLLHACDASLKVCTYLDDLVDGFKPSEPPSEYFKQALIQRFELQRVANNYHPPENSGQLTEWIQSISIQRNLAQFKTLSITGENINEEMIDGYSLLPNVFVIKELALVGFEKHFFDSVVFKVVNHCQHLKRFQLEDCEASKQAIEMVQNSISACTGIKEIVIIDCQLGDILATIPAKTNLTHLNTLVFSKTLLADDGLITICKLFPKMHSLKSLHLDYNNFKMQGAVYLVIYLVFLQELLDINLSGNAIGECLGFIFQSLAYVPRISKINVSSTQLHESQHELIIGCMKEFIYLECILFDMTSTDVFLSGIKERAPEFCHIYKDNPEMEMSIEFKG